MNGYSKRSAWFAATLLGWAMMVLLSCNAQGEDESLPPEVQALIGMKIPPKVKGREPRHIPKFIESSSRMLNRQIGDEIPKAELGYDEGIVEMKWPVFIVSAIHKDKTLEILDAQLLPEDLINWRYVNGEFKGIGNRFAFSNCHSSIDERRIILGLVKPENDYEGLSSDVARAWEINPQSGHIKTVPTQDIKCVIIGE